MWCEWHSISNGASNVSNIESFGITWMRPPNRVLLLSWKLCEWSERWIRDEFVCFRPMLLITIGHIVRLTLGFSRGGIRKVACVREFSFVSLEEEHPATRCSSSWPWGNVFQDRHKRNARIRFLPQRRLIGRPLIVRWTYWALWEL